MVQTIFRFAAALLLTGALGACASNVRTTALVPEATAQSLAPEDSPLHRNISIGRVDGGAETKTLGLTQVSASELQEALQNAMLLASMLGGTDSALTVDATLEKLEQPQLAVNLEVISTIFYRVRSIRTGAIVYQERIVTPHTTQFTESIIRSERQRLANEGAIKENIRVFLEKLNAAAKAEPYKFL
ncbi:MAG: hypothetical protein AAFR16_09040 [Pseudomonadota bacterium]